jgi:hypothetical protein
MQECGMTKHELPHGCKIVATDRGRHAARKHQPRPAWQTVASRQHKLRM